MYKKHRKIKLKDICGRCGAKMKCHHGAWVCPNKELDKLEVLKNDT